MLTVKYKVKVSVADTNVCNIYIKGTSPAQSRPNSRTLLISYQTADRRPTEEQKQSENIFIRCSERGNESVLTVRKGGGVHVCLKLLNVPGVKTESPFNTDATQLNTYFYFVVNVNVAMSSLLARCALIGQRAHTFVNCQQFK